MRKKIGTLLDEGLLEQAKKLSLREKLPLNRVIENALEDYFGKKQQEGLLSLEEVLLAKPGSYSGHAKGRGAGDINDEDFD